MKEATAPENIKEAMALSENPSVPQGNSLNLDGRSIELDMATACAAVMERSGKPSLASTEQLEALRDLQSQWDLTIPCMQGDVRELARQSYEQQQRETASEFLLPGQTIAASDQFTLEDHIEDARERVKAGKKRLYEITWEAGLIAREIVEKFCPLAGEVAALLEKNERALFSEFGGSYAASPLIAALKALPARLRVNLPTSKGNCFPPKLMVAGIVNL